MLELTPEECVSMQDACQDKAVSHSSAIRREKLFGKLSALFEQQLSAIERQGEGPQRLDTLERDCKALDLLARAFDRLVQTEMRTKVPIGTSTKRDGKATEGETAYAKSASQVGSEKTADGLRDELARRLYGLQQRETDTQPVKQPESD